MKAVLYRDAAKVSTRTRFSGPSRGGRNYATSLSDRTPEPHPSAGVTRGRPPGSHTCETGTIFDRTPIAIENARVWKRSWWTFWYMAGVLSSWSMKNLSTSIGMSNFYLCIRSINRSPRSELPRLICINGLPWHIFQQPALIISSPTIFRETVQARCCRGQGAESVRQI